MDSTDRVAELVEQWVNGNCAAVVDELLDSKDVVMAVKVCASLPADKDRSWMTVVLGTREALRRMDGGRR